MARHGTTPGHWPYSAGGVASGSAARTLHFWGAAERQIACITGERSDGPEGCPMLSMTKQLFETIWYIHQEGRPWLLAMIEMRRPTKTIILIQSPEELDRFVADFCLTATQVQG